MEGSCVPSVTPAPSAATTSETSNASTEDANLIEKSIDEHSTTLTARVPVFVDVVEAKYLLIPEDPSKVQKRRRGLTGKHLGLSPI